MDNKTTDMFSILSPLLILLITQSTAVLFGRSLNTLVYIPIILIYWVVLGLILYRYGLDQIRKWLQKPQGHWVWPMA